MKREIIIIVIVNTLTRVTSQTACIVRELLRTYFHVGYVQMCMCVFVYVLMCVCKCPSVCLYKSKNSICVYLRA